MIQNLSIFFTEGKYKKKLQDLKSKITYIIAGKALLTLDNTSP